MVWLSLPLPKSGLNYLSRRFISLKSEDKKTLGLKLFQVWTNLTTVLLVEGKVRKLGLKLRIEKTKAYMAAKILAKLKKNTRLDKFLKKKQESKVCPKKVGLFQFKVGWLNKGRDKPGTTKLYVPIRP